MAFIKNTSFGIAHQILNSEGLLASETKDVMAMFDFNKNEKTGFPIDL